MSRTGAPLGTGRRVLNGAIAGLLRLGVGPRRMWLLTTRGRRTGELRTTPVSLVELAGDRYLVSPYGVPAWVLNARAAGTVMLRRGRRSEACSVTELGAREAGPVLERYARQEPIVLPWFEAQPGDAVETFVAEADRHPVFRLG